MWAIQRPLAVRDLPNIDYLPMLVKSHGWQEPAKTTLDHAVKAGGAARSEAERVIDFLGRRGYTIFGALLAH